MEVKYRHLWQTIRRALLLAAAGIERFLKDVPT